MGVPPKLRGFKPLGTACHENEAISLHFDEYEAFRLATYEKLPQDQAAVRMNVSRPTFTRIYNKALEKIAKAFVEGQTIIIEGGDVQLDKNWYRCNHCHAVFQSVGESDIYCHNCQSNDVEHINRTLQDWRLGDEKTAEKTCICPSCGKRKSGKLGVPCREEQCPDCKSNMMRTNNPK